MKKRLKIILLVGIIFCASCTTTTSVVSSSSFKENTTKVIKDKLKADGYFQVDKLSQKEFDGTVYTFSSSSHRGNGNSRTNTTASVKDNPYSYNNRVDVNVSSRTNSSETDYTHNSSVTTMGSYKLNTYSFEDSAGRSVQYQVRYYVNNEYDHLTEKNVLYYTGISLVGCSTSDKFEYEKYCGDDGLIPSLIDNPQKDTVEFTDEEGTLGILYILLGVVSLLGLVLVCSI